MGSFKWKKVLVPTERTGAGVQYKKMKINRMSNYQLFRFVNDKGGVFKQLRKVFSSSYKQAVMIAEKRGIA